MMKPVFGVVPARTYPAWFWKQALLIFSWNVLVMQLLNYLNLWVMGNAKISDTGGGGYITA